MGLTLYQVPVYQSLNSIDSPSTQYHAVTPKVWHIQLKGSHDCAYLPLHVLVGDPPRHLTRKGSDSIWQGALRLKVARMLSIMEFKSEVTLESRSTYKS